MTVQEYATLRSRAVPHLLLDVREAEERAIARLDPCVWIPMAEIPERVGELNASQQIVVLCHHGVRSGRVTQYLRRLGFAQVENLEGGIDAWSAEIDPSISRY